MRHDLWLRRHSDRVRHIVAERARHGQSRHIDIGQPHAPRSRILAHWAWQRSHSSAALNHSLLFLGNVQFVINRQRLGRQLSALRVARYYDGARVAHVASVHCAVHHQRKHQRGAAERRVDVGFAQRFHHLGHCRLDRLLRLLLVIERFQIFRQFAGYQRRHIVPVFAVAVAHSKQTTIVLAVEVVIAEIRVLVHFVFVVRHIAFLADRHKLLWFLLRNMLRAHCRESAAFLHCLQLGNIAHLLGGHR
mmetsp:Transcript_1987/g.3219  ORF Transcript_1987/g.3219 Transcript_1987/m.3219 type:complete len:248 (-) Transcript_1987:418-1161(-)